MDEWLVRWLERKKNWDTKSEKNHYTPFTCVFTAPPIAITLGISSNRVFLFYAPIWALACRHLLYRTFINFSFGNQKNDMCACIHWLLIVARKNDITFQNVPQTMRRAWFFTCKFLYYIFLSPRKNVPRNRNERLRRREQKRGILLLHVYIEYIISQWVCAVCVSKTLEFHSAKLHFHFHVGFAFLRLARCDDA